MSTRPTDPPFPAAGQRILALAEKRGLTLAALARRAAISPGTVRDACDGRAVTVGVAVEIAYVLGVSVESLWREPRRPRRDAKRVTQSRRAA